LTTIERAGLGLSVSPDGTIAYTVRCQSHTDSNLLQVSLNTLSAQYQSNSGEARSGPAQPVAALLAAAAQQQASLYAARMVIFLQAIEVADWLAAAPHGSGLLDEVLRQLAARNGLSDPPRAVMRENSATAIACLLWMRWMKYPTGY
jgi:hypothetical protein